MINGIKGKWEHCGILLHHATTQCQSGPHGCVPLEKLVAGKCPAAQQPSNHLTLCHPLLLLPLIFPRIRVFSNESALHIRWPKYWSFSFNIRPSNEHPGLYSIHTYRCIYICYLNKHINTYFRNREFIPIPPYLTFPHISYFLSFSFNFENSYFQNLQIY